MPWRPRRTAPGDLAWAWRLDGVDHFLLALRHCLPKMSLLQSVWKSRNWHFWRLAYSSLVGVHHLVHWNPNSSTATKVLLYSINDLYFRGDSSKSFGTLEKEALHSIRRAKALPHNLRYNRKGSCARKSGYNTTFWFIHALCLIFVRISLNIGIWFWVEIILSLSDNYEEKTFDQALFKPT